MGYRQPYKDIAPLAPKIDTSKLEELAEKNSNKEMIDILIKMVEKLSVQNSINVAPPPPPNVSVNMDVAKIVKSIPESKAPVVNMNTDALAQMMNKPEKEPCAYSFEIERDGHGRIKRVLANPVGK